MNKEEQIVVGATSKFGIFVCKYPFRVMLIVITSWEIFAFLNGENNNHLLRGLVILLAVCLPLLVLMYILSNKWCYKIEIDTSNQSIIFYRLCNRAACIFLQDRITIVIDSYCHIFVGDSEFILHADYIHDLVSYLPKDTVVVYKGRVGKYKENHWEKGPLIPGSRKLGGRP